MAHSSAIFQPPPGTRDFYPEQMALRRYLEDTWRRVSLRHGFAEIDGPTFEYLDLYKVKSGDEIVSQLFHFESRGEDKTEFALRPEFTPTLARMVAARANSLPRPIKWFSIPRCYRAERPQKGRLREFFQWNVDMLGGDTPEQRRQYDLEVVALFLDCIREFGLSPDEVTLRWNDRTIVERLFQLARIPSERFSLGYYVLDRVHKTSSDERKQLYAKSAVREEEEIFFEKIAKGENPMNPDFWSYGGLGERERQTYRELVMEAMGPFARIRAFGLDKYFKPEPDPTIVRGLAYYTGFVWEAADVAGKSRALAGGGRYDKLIEMFGGPALAATGFGAGDVTLGDMLHSLGKLPRTSGQSPDVFVVSALASEEHTMGLLGDLRAAKLSAITSYKSTRNIGKLLQEASSSGAKLALILAPQEFDKGLVKLKNLSTREEKEIPLAQAVEAIRATIVSS